MLVPPARFEFKENTSRDLGTAFGVLLNPSPNPRHGLEPLQTPREALETPLKAVYPVCDNLSQGDPNLSHTVTMGPRDPPIRLAVNRVGVRLGVVRKFGVCDRAMQHPFEPVTAHLLATGFADHVNTPQQHRRRRRVRARPRHRRAPAHCALVHESSGLWGRECKPPE